MRPDCTYTLNGEKMDFAAFKAAVVQDPALRAKYLHAGATPSMPFEKTWPLQLFKRALRDAVAAGKSWICWTFGATQADRFDLSKQVESIRAERRKTFWALDITDKSGNTTTQEVPLEKLPDFVGKDLARKIDQDAEENPDGKEYSGLDLKVGGEGMKGFYDNILPKEIGKYVKQWGGKVEKSTVGQPKEGTGKLTRDEISEARKDARLILKGDMDAEEFNDAWGTSLSYDDIPGDDPSRRTQFVDGILAAVKQQRLHSAGGVFPAWRVNITPEMSEGVEAGQPLYAQSFENLMADAGVDTDELDQAYDQAAGEQSGSRETGNPSRSLGGGVDSPSDPVIFGTDHYYDAVLTAQSHEVLRERARAMLEEDYEGWVEYFVGYALAGGGQGLAGHEAMAAQMAVERESRLPLTTERKRRLQALVWAYRLSGTVAGRDLSARRDPFKTPIERNREFLAKAIFEPSPAMAKKIEKAETPEKRQKLLDIDAQRIEKIRKVFAKMGISLEEILNGDVKMGLIKSEVVLGALAGLPEVTRKAVEMTQGGEWSFKEIAKDTGLTEKAIIEAQDAAWAKIEADIRRRASLAAQSTALSAQSPAAEVIDYAALGALSPEELDAAIAKLKQEMGFFPHDQQGKRKTVKRKPTKLFVPPVTAGHREKRREQARLPLGPPDRNAPRVPSVGPGRGTGGPVGVKTPGMDRNDAEGDRLGKLWVDAPVEVSVRVGANMADTEDMVRLFRMAQAVDGKPLDMAKEAWINGILSGPATQVANIVGNAASGALEFTFQRGMEALWNLAARDAKGATFGEIAPMTKAVIRPEGFKEAVQIVRESDKVGKAEMRMILQALSPALAQATRFMAKAWRTESDFFAHEVLAQQGELFETGPKGEQRRVSIGGQKGRVVRVPGRALMAMDGFFQGMFGQMEAAAQAYRIAKSEGLKGDALQKRLNELVSTPGSPAWELAVKKAQELVFQDDLPESVRVFQQLVNSTRIGSFLFPFVKTPYNIFRAGIRKSPLGALNLAWHIGKHGLAKISADGKIETAASPQMVRWLAEQTFAWLGMALLWGAAGGDDDDDKKYFLITGAPPRDRGEKALMDRAVGGGFQIKIGDFTMNYGRIEPMATTLGTMMDGIRAIKSGATSGSAAASILDNIKGQVMNKTFLTGLATIMEAMDPNSHAKWDEKARRALLSALVPNLIRQPLRNTDEVVRDSSTASWWYPAWPSAGNGGVPIVDPATGVDKTKGGNALSRLVQAPVAPRMELSEADRTLIAYNRAHPGKGWTPEAPDNEITYTPKIGNNPAVRVELNKEAYHYLQVRSATLAKNMLKGRKFAADDAGIDAIKRVYSDARNQARDELARRPVERIGTAK